MAGSLKDMPVGGDRVRPSFGLKKLDPCMKDITNGTGTVSGLC